MTEVAADPYAWWRNALQGTKGPIKDGQPQAGFYRRRLVRGGPWVPIAIFPDGNGGMFARQGRNFADVVDAAAVWPYCADNPVPEDHARKAAAEGLWPGDLPPMETAEAPSDDQRLGIGGNFPPESPPPEKETDEQVLERLSTPPAPVKSKIEELAAQTAEAGAWLTKTMPIRTKEEADLAANWCDRLTGLNKAVEEERMGLRRPLQNALQKIQDWFTPTQEAAKALAKRLDKAARDWADQEERRLREEARRKAEEERKRREEEERRLREEHERKLKEQGIDPASESAPPPPPPLLPIEEPAPIAVPKVFVGTSGRRRGARSAKKEIRIVNIEKLLLHLKDHPEIIKLATKIAEVQAIKGGIKVPGVEVIDPDAEEAA